MKFDCWRGVIAEIIVVGTGSKMQQLPPLLRGHLNSLGIQVEVLSSVC
jgi:uncharacterized protein